MEPKMGTIVVLFVMSRAKQRPSTVTQRPKHRQERNRQKKKIKIGKKKEKGGH